MTVQEAYDDIVKKMTPEQALKMMLGSAIYQYEQLKYDEQHEPVHPIMIITMAAHDLGWQISFNVENDDEEIQGLIVGTEEYVKSVLP